MKFLYSDFDEEILFDSIAEAVQYKQIKAQEILKQKITQVKNDKLNS